MYDFSKITPEMNDMLVACANTDHLIAIPAQRKLIAEFDKAYKEKRQANKANQKKALKAALKEPVREFVTLGNTINGIFEEVPIGMQNDAVFQVGFSKETAEQVVATLCSPTGRIEERRVDADEVRVETFLRENHVDTSLRMIAAARWDVVAKLWEMMYQGFDVEMSNYGWQTLIGAGISRNLLTYDDAATDGVFSKALVVRLQTAMRRNGGGNSSSVNRGQLTDLFISPEAMADIRSWSHQSGEIDYLTQREIYLAPEGSGAMSSIFGVRIHTLDELGVGKQYNDWFLANGGSLSGTSGKQEIVIGLDLSKNDSFVMPVRQDVQIFEDPTMHRSMRFGLYGWREYGMACLDVRRVILGAL